MKYNLDFARALVRNGVPVFAGRLDSEGNPDGRDPRWRKWDKTRPDIMPSVNSGDAVCAVGGVEVDFLDIDPRNGGCESWDAIMDDIGWIDGYSEVATSSGGLHIAVPALGLGSHSNILPGIDLKGGRRNGAGRGFVFIPPTVRPSKDMFNEGELVPYQVSRPLNVNGDINRFRPVRSLLASLIRDRQESLYFGGEGGETSYGRISPGRESADKLRRECIAAEAGGQRNAMLRYVHELERKGYERNDIIVLLRSLCAEMPVYDTRRPWYPARGNPDKELLTLFHRKGVVTPDATPGEAKILESLDEVNSDAGRPSRPRPGARRANGNKYAEWEEGKRSYQSEQRNKILHNPSPFVGFYDGVRPEVREWFWRNYILRGYYTLLDGDKGHGKSLISVDLAARATRGLPMPMAERRRDPVNVLLIGFEDSRSDIRSRLRAAGADLSRVAHPELPRDDDGNYYTAALPSGAALIDRMVKDSDAGLVILDPVTSFLDESVNSHNDASVRRALTPFAEILQRNKAAGWLHRHLNKNSQMEAHLRGTGSSAFQNIGRVQLMVQRVPPELQTMESGEYGLVMLNTNVSAKVPGAITYDIDDSDVVISRDGDDIEYAPRIVWREYLESMTVADLSRGSGGGRQPSVELDEICFVMSDLFANRDSVPSKEAEKELHDAGYRAHGTIDKAKQRLGIRSRKFGMEWCWVMAKKESVV